MNKAELIEKIANDTGYPKQTVNDVLASLKSTARETLLKGGEIKISGTGVLTVKAYGERVSRNPKTGEKIVAKPTIKAVFKLSEYFLEEK